MRRSIKMLLVLTGATLAIVGCERSPEKAAEKVTSKISRELELTDTQKAQLDRIKVRLLELHQTSQQSRDQFRSEVKDLVLAEKLERQNVKFLMEGHRQNMEDRFESAFPLIQDFHATLSLEQKQKLVGLLEKFHERRKHH